MGFFDVLIGRSKQAPADLDHLFALPAAAVTLQADLELSCADVAAVCFKPGTGAAFASVESQLTSILGAADASDNQATVTLGSSPSSLAPPSNASWHRSDDEYGYRWVVLHTKGIEEIVTRAHMVNASLQDAGFGPALLCSAFCFLPPRSGLTPDTVFSALDQGTGDRSKPVHLIYLYKRGTFYPFAPRGGQTRDNEMELRVRSSLASELPLEPDLSRWFPLWGLPLP